MIETSSSFLRVCDSRDRLAWLAERQKGIGASEASAILGLSPWKSPLAVYAEKIGILTEDKEESEAMRWGRILEPEILREFARETGREVQPSGILLRSTARPWQLATLDGVQRQFERAGPGLVEVKATSARVSDWADGVPDYVQIQVQHQLDVTGYDWGSVVVLQNGNRLLWTDVERDPALIVSIREAEAEFWRRVESGEPPDPDGSKASRDALRALYPKDSGETIALPGELIEADEKRQELGVFIKNAEIAREIIDNQIRAALGFASFGTLPNGVTYSYRLQKRAERVVPASEFRVLRRSKAKE